MIARMNVKAGIRLERDEARVGVVYSSPLYPKSWATTLPHSHNLSN